jgi:DNA-binding MarR family transcriptional regulator
VSATRRLQTRIASRFTDREFSFVDWIALMLVRDGVASTAGDLSRDLGINPGATTRLIDGLVAQDLLERDHTSPDRRVVLIQLTPRGRAKIKEKVPSMVSIWNEIFKEFEQNEAKQLVELMQRLVDAMERIPA